MPVWCWACLVLSEHSAADSISHCQADKGPFLVVDRQARPPKLPILPTKRACLELHGLELHGSRPVLLIDRKARLPKLPILPTKGACLVLHGGCPVLVIVRKARFPKLPILPTKGACLVLQVLHGRSSSETSQATHPADETCLSGVARRLPRPGDRS